MISKTILAASVAGFLTLGAAEDIPAHHKIFEVELENGDQMAVILDSNPIHLTKLGKDYLIEPESIIVLDNDHGLSGILEGSPLKKHIDRSFVKDPELTVYLTSSKAEVKLPWEHIRHIRWLDNLDASVQFHAHNENSRLPKGEEAGIAIRYVPVKSTDRVFAEADQLPDFHTVLFDASREFSEDEKFTNMPIALEEAPTVKLTPEMLVKISDDLMAENAEPVKSVGEDIDPKAFEQKETDEQKSSSDIEFVSERERKTPNPASVE